MNATQKLAAVATLAEVTARVLLRRLRHYHSEAERQGQIASLEAALEPFDIEDEPWTPEQHTRRYHAEISDNPDPASAYAVKPGDREFAAFGTESVGQVASAECDICGWYLLPTTRPAAASAQCAVCGDARHHVARIVYHPSGAIGFEDLRTGKVEYPGLNNT